MVTLSYLLIKDIRPTTIRFATVQDATDAGVALLNHPEILCVNVQEDGYRAYPIRKDARFVVHYSEDGDAYSREYFADIDTAVRFAATHNHFQIYDLFKNEICCNY